MTIRFILVVAAFWSFTVATASAQGTAFLYQGRLNDGAIPANGSYDLTFALYDSTNLPGNIVAGPITNSATQVINGLFAVSLDFGNAFPGAARWMEIAVRTNGATNFITLSPRQPITPAPYAIQAARATTATTAQSAQNGARVFRLNPPGVYCQGGNVTAAYNGNVRPASVDVWYSLNGSNWQPSNGSTNFAIVVSADLNSVTVTNLSPLCLSMEVDVVY
jgi:hypothetical protein